MSKFPPGMYRMRNGEKAEVFAERDGALWGRMGMGGAWVAHGWKTHGRSVNQSYESEYDLISPWTEERKPFECWVVPFSERKWACAHLTKENAENCASNPLGPAIRMIESTPLTLAAGEMLEMLERFVRPSKDVTRYDEARALICRARGET